MWHIQTMRCLCPLTIEQFIGTAQLWKMEKKHLPRAHSAHEIVHPPTGKKKRMILRKPLKNQNFDEPNKGCRCFWYLTFQECNPGRVLEEFLHGFHKSICAFKIYYILHTWRRGERKKNAPWWALEKELIDSILAEKNWTSEFEVVLLQSAPKKTLEICGFSSLPSMVTWS